MIHEYINVGNGALYCKPCEVVVTERDGAGAVSDMKEHEADPCCEECVALRTGEDEQTRQNALQDSINAAYERLKAASIGYSLQQGVFLIGKDEE